MIPIIPILALGAIGAGSVTLYKYNKLSKMEKDEANRKVLKTAEHIAKRQFKMELSALSQAQKKLAYDMAKQALGYK